MDRFRKIKEETLQAESNLTVSQVKNRPLNKSDKNINPSFNQFNLMVFNKDGTHFSDTFHPYDLGLHLKERGGKSKSVLKLNTLDFGDKKKKTFFEKYQGHQPIYSKVNLHSDKNKNERRNKEKDQGQKLGTLDKV